MIYRTLLVTLATLVLASPVFAADAPDANNMPTSLMSAPESNAASANQNTQININTAKVRDLIRVKGINASKARAIVAYRKKHGNFKNVDALAKVKGFTRMKMNDLKAIEDQLTI